MRCILGLLIGFAWAFQPASSWAADDVTITDCRISADEEAEVPAQEAGVLMKIFVREGQQVAAGSLLAQIDDVIPRAQHNVAAFKLKVAQKQALDDIDVRYATAAYEYARAKLERSLKANAKIAGTVPEEVVDEQRLEKEKFKLSIEKAKKDLDVAALQVDVSGAEAKAAEENEKRRQILAPLKAEVSEFALHEGEWVQAGQTVMKLVRVDRLRVQGFISAKGRQRSDIQDRPVQVIVTFSQDQRMTFPGKVVYVKPELNDLGEFLVRAEIENKEQNGVYILSPGMYGDMIIHLK
jgi:multidrug efflux pump subunit AcrA (membrane-fusion protein)